MADVEVPNPAPLAQHYLVEDKQKPEMAAKSTEESKVKPVVETAAEEVAEKIEETTNVVSNEAASAAVEKDVEASDSATEESKDSKPDEAADDADLAPGKESNDNTESDNTVEEETNDTPEIKLETAPADFRFPTTNQTRHCFTRYIEYHRCVAAKGDGAPECEKFAKYYRSLCPSEWVERWNEQRENGTFPGPL